jgi:hypothetical protein
METRASYVLIGSFTLAILAAAFLFVLWIGKLSFDREWDYYDIVFTEGRCSTVASRSAKCANSRSIRPIPNA